MDYRRFDYRLFLGADVITMYKLDENGARLLTRRSIERGVTFAAIGALVLLAAARLGGFSPLGTLGMFCFYAAATAVSVPQTAFQKSRRFREYRYELTPSYARVWSEHDPSVEQVVRWDDVADFQIARKRNYSFVLLYTAERESLRIWHADLLASDANEPCLVIKAAAFLGNAR